MVISDYAFDFFSPNPMWIFKRGLLKIFFGKQFNNMSHDTMRGGLQKNTSLCFSPIILKKTERKCQRSKKICQNSIKICQKTKRKCQETKKKCHESKKICNKSKKKWNVICKRSFPGNIF